MNNWKQITIALTRTEKKRAALLCAFSQPVMLSVMHKKRQ